jgi:hypothetical protein
MKARIQCSGRPFQICRVTKDVANTKGLCAMSLNFDMLANFTGSQQWFKHGLARTVLFTEGVKYVADNAGAYWLIDIIALSQVNNKVRVEEFQVWNLSVKDGKATISCDDGNDNIVLTQSVDYTDFPEPGIKFYVEFGDGHYTIMLPSER